MRPVTFPKWPEKVLWLLVAAVVIVVASLATRTFDKFGGRAATSTFLVGISYIFSLVLIAFTVKRHRIRTEQRAAKYEKELRRLAQDG